jgi:hypothetical protein
LADIRNLERHQSPEKDSSPELSESFEIYLKQKRKKVQDEKLKLAAESNKENQEPPVEIEDSFEEIQHSFEKSREKVQEIIESPQRVQDSSDEIQEIEDSSPEMTNESIKKFNTPQKQVLESPKKINEQPKSPRKPFDFSQAALKMTPKGFPMRFESPQIEDVDDSFLELEKMCENTLTLNNVSELLTDLTTMDASVVEVLMKKKLSINPEETRKSFLDDIEPPSFMSNLTMFSPKNSPFRKTVHENRPSTIMEVTELSNTIKSGSSSYRTAEAASSYEKSECYQTANEESWISGSIKKRGFYDDSTNYTKDSLDVTQKPNITQMTQDSLNEDTGNATAESTFENEISFDNNGALNDTLEAIERILAQGNMNTPKKIIFDRKKSNPSTPQAVTTPKQTSKASPTPWSTVRNPKGKTANLTPKNSPLIKFSPTSATKSPASNFKLPNKPLSSSKTTPFSSTHAKKFQHIVSPIARYINNTPELPLSANAHTQFGLGSRQPQFNFRDSESFVVKENKSGLPPTGSSLPMRAKTKTTTPVIIDYFILRFFFKF